MSITLSPHTHPYVQPMVRFGMQSSETVNFPRRPPPPPPTYTLQPFQLAHIARKLINAVRDNNLGGIKKWMHQVPWGQHADVLLKHSKRGNTTLRELVASHKNPGIQKAILALLPSYQHWLLAINENSLWEAINDHNPEWVKALLPLLPRKKLDTLIRDGATWHKVINSGHPNLIEAFLDPLSTKQRAEVIGTPVKKAAFGRTALHLAVLKRRPELVKILLAALPQEQRLEIMNQPDHIGFSAIHWAADRIEPNSEIIRTLLLAVPKEHGIALVNQPAQVNAPNINGKTPLQQLAETANTLLDQSTRPIFLDRASVLIAYGADPNQLSEEFRTEVNTQHAQQINSLSARLVNPAATPAQVVESMSWFQQFPFGGGELNWQLPTDRCNAFLSAQLDRLDRISAREDQLNAVNFMKRHKIPVLNRLRPILKSGISFDPNLLSRVAEHAVITGHWSAVDDALQAGTDHKALAVSIVNEYGELSNLTQE